MASRKLLRSIVLLAPLAIVPGALVAQGATMQAWCGSDPDGPVVYLSQIFDTGLGRPEPGVDIGGPIAFEFLWYLRGRYDYKTSGNRPTSCGPGTTGYATESRRNFKATAETAGKQVVELEWEFTPDTAAPPAAGAGRVGWCFSSGATETVCRGALPAQGAHQRRRVEHRVWPIPHRQIWAPRRWAVRHRADPREGTPLNGFSAPRRAGREPTSRRDRLGLVRRGEQPGRQACRSGRRCRTGSSGAASTASVGASARPRDQGPPSSDAAL